MFGQGVGRVVRVRVSLPPLPFCRYNALGAHSATKLMRLGVTYNVYDGEELLEASARSVRAHAAHIVVVYQLVSNYGEPARPGLELMLQSLLDRGIVDELLRVDPVDIPPGEARASVVSKDAPRSEVGNDPTFATLNEAFFLELKKREEGRRCCAAAGCSHFMSMDTDEFYLHDQLASLARMMEEPNPTTGRLPLASVATMRLLFKDPRWELLPQEDSFKVPVICVCDDAYPLKLLPNWQMVVDPTRRIDCAREDVLIVPRDTCEMWHMSFVRRDVSCKLRNTSNRANYGAVADSASDPASQFLRDFEAWQPHMTPIHPHPVWNNFYKSARVLSNHFDVDLDTCCDYCLRPKAPLRCARCQAVRYCDAGCQRYDWKTHKKKCGEGSAM